MTSLTTNLPSSVPQSISPNFISDANSGASVNSIKGSVVLSFGASNTLVGYGGESDPRWILKSCFSHTDSNGFIYSYLDICNLLRSDSTKSLALDAISSFIENIFVRYLIVNPDSVRVIIVENMSLILYFKRAIAEIMFKRFRVHSIQFIPAQPLALVPLQKSTGIVVDVGYSETNIISVYSNIVIPHSLSSSSLGAMTIHNNILDLLHSYNCTLPSGYILEDSVPSDEDAKPLSWDLDWITLDDMCKQLCYISISPPSEASKSNSQKTSLPNPKYVPYVDRKGRMYRINKEVREKAAEVLFYGQNENFSIPSCILDSLLSCPIDLKFDLAHNILLIGGVSMMRGFATRLIKELELKLASSQKYSKLSALRGHFELIHSPIHFHPHLSWIGASVDSLIDGLHTANTISLREYAEGSKPLPDWTLLTANQPNE